MLSVLHNRNFARLFYAGATSTAGFAIGQVALTWIVWTNTSSSLDVAYIGVSFIAAAVIFSLAAGALVDRHERRKLMVLSDLVRAGTLAALVVSLLVLGFNLAAVLLVAFILGSFTTLFQPAERALTPEVIGNEQIAHANALIQTSTSVIQFASNTAGAGIIALTGVVAAFGLNTITFLISALLIAGIVGFSGKKLPPGDGIPEKRPSMFEDIREGFRYIGRNRALLELTLSAGIGNFFLSMVFQFFVVYADVLLKGGVVAYGIISGLFALGWAPGAFISARFRTVRYAGRIWIFAGVIEGALVVGLALLPYLIPALALAFAMGVLLGLTNTTWLTSVQLIVPTEMQGRYFGLDQLGSFAVIPVGQVLGGVIIATSGVSIDFVIAGIGAAAGAGLFILSPNLRNLGWKSPGTPATG
jgi:MFS family permease